MKNKYSAHESSIIDEGAEIGDGTKIWHFSHIMAGSIMGVNCNLGQNVVISPKVILGNNVKVQNNVSFYTGVICGDDVFIGPSVVFTNISNPRSEVSRKNKFVETKIGNGATIGANATIICGNSIGKYAFIGAGSVVTKIVLPYSLVVGNPARHIGWMSEFGHRLFFNDKGFAKCPESGDMYLIETGIVSKSSE